MTEHKHCGTPLCCGLCDTANIVVGDTPPLHTQKELEKQYAGQTNEQVYKAVDETTQSRSST